MLVSIDTQKISERVNIDKKIKILIKENFVRIIGGPKKVKKFFHRNFGNNDKAVKLLLKAGLENGVNEIKISKFLDILKDNEKKSLINRTIKKVLKSEISDLSNIKIPEGFIENKKALTMIRKELFKINKSFIKNNKYDSYNSVELGKLPVQGFNSEEIRKLFD